MAAVEPGAGERMVNRALVEVNRLLGRFGSEPVRPGQAYGPSWKRP